MHWFSSPLKKGALLHERGAVTPRLDRGVYFAEILEVHMIYLSSSNFIFTAKWIPRSSRGMTTTIPIFMQQPLFQRGEDMIQSAAFSDLF